MHWLSVWMIYHLATSFLQTLHTYIHTYAYITFLHNLRRKRKKTAVHSVKTSHQRCPDILTDKVRHILLLIIIKKRRRKKKRKERHVRIATTRPLKGKKKKIV